MTQSALRQIEINGQVYCPVRQAARHCPYSVDYVTRLARERKVKSVKLSRCWYVHIDSLQVYAAVQKQEQVIRQRHLQRDRQAEQKRRVKLETLHSQSTVSPSGHGLQFAGALAILLALGGVVGLQLQYPVIDIAAQAAGVAVSNDFAVVSPTVVAKQDTALRATFSTDTDILISTGRTMLRPDQQGEWSYITYE